MHDAGSLRVPAGGSVREDTMDQRARSMPRGGMDDDTGRLVDDEQMLVLVDAAKSDVFRLEWSRSLGPVELDLFPTGETHALACRGTVHEHGTPLQQPLGRRSRADLGKTREKAVEPEPGRLARNLDSEP